MDYKEIILNGYFDIETRDNLDKYFFRMFKKAEKEEFFEPDEFFEGLHSIVRSFENEINSQLQNRKQDLKKWFTLEKNQDKKESYKHQISCTEKDDFPLNMGNYRILYWSNLKFIKDAITKAYLISPENEKTQQNYSKLEISETDLSEKIKKHFGFFNGNCPRKHKQILKDEDFDKLIKWTIWYFENDFKVPEISEPIKVVNTNKTFAQLAFKYLFKHLHKSSPYPETLFELYQNVFTPYSEDKRSNFEAVKNNDEVKKLMLIDY